MTETGVSRPNAQGDEVVDDRAERPGEFRTRKTWYASSPVSMESSSSPGVEIEVAVEEQIADQRDRELRKSGEQRIQAVEGEHGDTDMGHTPLADQRARPPSVNGRGESPGAG